MRISNPSPAPGALDEIRPEFLKALWAVLVDTRLEHCMEVRDSASELAHRVEDSFFFLRNRIGGRVLSFRAHSAQAP